ncbi:MAG TPA: cupredoxin domain-containing protein [Candidatus Limnocylindrales bacterium]|nr:cupredoxin domain-containing protein [Candidatus Limnocylindrales bacterium]
MTEQPETRAERRAATLAERRADRARIRAAAAARSSQVRTIAFVSVVTVVLALGALLAFGDFLDRPGGTAGTIDVQSSMAGFTPSEIRVTAGTTATLDWWTDDAAIHLQGGVHTMVAPELGLNEALPAEGRRTVVWQVPNRPGTYDVYCETCCGGKDSPSMHGRIVIEAA